MTPINFEKVKNVCQTIVVKILAAFSNGFSNGFDI